MKKNAYCISVCTRNAEKRQKSVDKNAWANGKRKVLVKIKNKEEKCTERQLKFLTIIIFFMHRR